ncbi:hypothetical protein OG625_06975 [Streptomyces sp. NBC_01351]|uniref:hypothetical protein n=1 Tax=Streptomyces sp. NBC_01351 TaxID=2903833 RepID=UPI002E34CA5B|nr:hypothetical protein [Streptomyces sp. NBC_01351]
MTTDDLDTTLRSAALNNAGFCDAVCRAHGLPADFDGEYYWLSTSRTPPLYPDAVTLSPETEAPSLLQWMDTDSPGCSVKDSFANLDLEGDGFEVLFDAQWIHRPAGAPADGASGLEWSAVADDGELEVWEAAWDGEESTGLFRPELLGEGMDIVFLAARRDGRIVAGAVLNRAGGVVGVSNLFAHDEADTDAAWTGALTAAAARWPELDVVGYESGDDLDAALRHGFTAIGPLRVWLRTSDKTRYLRRREK